MALPYGVKVYCGEDLAMTLKQIDYNCFCECWENEDLKCNSRWMLPYLRTMSSMTEEEATEYANCGNIVAISHQNDYLIPNPKSINWLLENHFDFMGLIPKDLAIEVTEDNNPYKE